MDGFKEMVFSGHMAEYIRITKTVAACTRPPQVQTTEKWAKTPALGNNLFLIDSFWERGNKIIFLQWSEKPISKKEEIISKHKTHTLHRFQQITKTPGSDSFAARFYKCLKKIQYQLSQILSKQIMLTNSFWGQYYPDNKARWKGHK